MYHSVFEHRLPLVLYSLDLFPQKRAISICVATEGNDDTATYLVVHTENDINVIFILTTVDITSKLIIGVI